jgi:hypothetical protein
MHHPGLRSRHCQHLSLQPPHPIQHYSPVCAPTSYTDVSLLTERRCSALILIFIEIPLLLRICPTSSKFDAFIARFTTNYMRAAIYGVMSLVQWLSIIVDASSLIAAAIVLMLAGICYALAGLKQQEFVGSKTLGGRGVAQMIV